MATRAAQPAVMATRQDPPTVPARPKDPVRPGMEWRFFAPAKGGWFIGWALVPIVWPR
jgi:hypothetical protein